MEAFGAATRLGQRNHRSERLRLRSKLSDLGKALPADDRSIGGHARCEG